MNFDNSTRTENNTDYGWNDFTTRIPNFYSNLEMYPEFDLKQENLEMLNGGVATDSPMDMGKEQESNMSSHTVSNLSSPSNQMSSQMDARQVNASETSSSHSFHDGDKKTVKRNKNKKQTLEDQDAALIARDDSELTEDELVLKRKAQNRAAQRAFRERKESKMKELEEKLNKSEEEKQKLIIKLEELRKQNMTIQTENDILKAQTRHAPMKFANPSLPKHAKSLYPMSPMKFAQTLLSSTEHEINEKTLNKVYVAPESPGSTLLAVGAVWDYIQVKCEERQLDPTSIDILGIMEKLRGSEKCHGYGPAYEIGVVDEVINEVLI